MVNGSQYLFTLPLMFQVILLDSPSRAGTRLVTPCLATPLGGLIAGIVMSRWGKLAYIVRIGAALMLVGNILVMLLRFNDSEWKYSAFVIPANLGQGMVYPGILFTFLAAFDHAGKPPFLLRIVLQVHCRHSCSRRLVCLLITLLFRSCRLRFNSLSYPITWNRLGCCGYLHHHAEYTELRPRGGLE